MAKVLVTGAAGFIGTHLVHRLVSGGDRVVALDNLKRGARAKLAEHADAITFVEADIRHFGALRQAAAGCDIVFHLAAQSNVMGAVDDPEYSVTTNVIGTFNVLRAAAEVGARVVFTSSREAYGEPRELPVSEAQPLSAKNPYGASKASGEAYCRSFAQAHGLRVEVLRLANVYGAGDAGRLIPLWLTAAQEGSDLVVYGGGQIIDFVWVGTVVDALVYAAQHGLPGPMNVGSGVGTSIMTLGARVLAETGSRSRIVRAPARGIEVERFVADTRLMRALGFQPDPDPLAHLGELVAAYPPGLASPAPAA